AIISEYNSAFGKDGDLVTTVATIETTLVGCPEEADTTAAAPETTPPTQAETPADTADTTPEGGETTAATPETTADAQAAA
ncbi:MAG: hypothetical protein IKZ74_07240, partial [Clostridiales bacterium]|nr:hypothetical protein [Clostridiales bacterium]